MLFQRKLCLVDSGHMEFGLDVDTRAHHPLAARAFQARAPLTAGLGGGGIAVLFRYGVAVLLDAPPEAEQALRSSSSAAGASPVALAST